MHILVSNTKTVWLEDDSDISGVSICKECSLSWAEQVLWTSVVRTQFGFTLQVSLSFKGNKLVLT